MKMMEILINLIKIIKPFLQDGIFCVKIENKLSSSLPVAVYIFQGWVLAFTLYLMFINDIPTTSTAIISLLTDDIICLVANSNMNITIISAQ